MTAITDKAITGVAEIKDRVAFYPDRVDSIVEQKPPVPGLAGVAKASA